MFAKLVLKNKYQDYETALINLNLETLEKRRSELDLNFAKQCILNNKLKYLFPETDENLMKTRHHEKFKVNHANTNRMQNSAIIQMQHKLNKYHMEKEIKETQDEQT